MKLAIMQPYLFPYIGYFQLIKSVDQFVIYDNIQYTKKGWVNRNRILLNGKDQYLTFPLAKGSDFLMINQRNLSNDWIKERRKVLNKLQEAYKKAPYFNEIYPLIEQCVLFEQSNLFNYIYNSLHKISDYLEIKCQFIVSSSIPIDHHLRGSDKVIAINQFFSSSEYINAIGGTHLYDKMNFEHFGLKLIFLKSKKIEYRQFNANFIPNLSIIDVLMFCGKDKVKYFLNQYELM